MNKVKALCALFLMFIILLSGSVLAFGVMEEISPENEPLLRVEFFDGEKPLSGAEFKLFQIADIDEYGNYISKPEFEKFDIGTNGKNVEKWRELASTIEGYVYQEKIAPADKGITGADGIIEFPVEAERFVCGLYLLVGEPVSVDGFTYFAESAIIQLPMPSDDGETWNYDVTVKPKYTFVPDGEQDEFISRKVLKIWEDKGFEALRPKEITVYLLKDGEVFDTVKLNRENNWRYTWNELEEGYRWSVTEKVPEGYTVKIEREGITHVITNKITKEPISIVPENPPVTDEPQLPQTGQLWWPVPVLFCFGILFIAAGILCRRNGYEK